MVIDFSIVMRALIWLRQDLRDAVRSLRRTRTVTVAAIATLALGIGATTAIFSLVEAVLLRRLSVAAPDRLYFIAHGVGDTLSTASHYPWFERIQAVDGIFDGVTAYNIRELRVWSPEGVERLVGQYVSGNYHTVVGAPLQVGRGFSSEDDRVVTPIAVISDGYWSRRFGRSPDVLGKTLAVAGHSVTIVGVTAAGFVGMQPGRQVDITLPISLRVQDDPEFLTRIDTWTSMPLVARLKQDVAIVEARSTVAAAYLSYMALPPNQPFSRAAGGQLREATLQAAAQGSDALRRRYRTPLRALMAMVAVVLLITCANVASLLLMRAPARAREIAIRMSLGASRKRVVCQLLTESGLLAVCGGALGLLLAAWGTEFVSWLFRTALNPVVIDLQPDARVLAFALVISLLTGLAFGVAPAWRATGTDLAQALKPGEAAWRGGRRRLGHHALVGAQIAMCFVLVFGAGLFGRTLQNLHNVETGFRKDSVVVFALDVLDSAFDAKRLAPLCSDVIARMLARPDVRSGSCSTMSPVATNTEGRAVTVPGSGREPRNTPVVYANSIDAGYFRTLGIDVIRGRAITDQDTAASTRVGVLSEGMARYFFGEADPLGRTFSFGVEGDRPADHDRRNGPRRAPAVARVPTVHGLHAACAARRAREGAGCGDQDLGPDHGCRVDSAGRAPGVDPRPGGVLREEHGRTVRRVARGRTSSDHAVGVVRAAGAGSGLHRSLRCHVVRRSPPRAGHRNQAGAGRQPVTDPRSGPSPFGPPDDRWYRARRGHGHRGLSFGVELPVRRSAGRSRHIDICDRCSGCDVTHRGLPASSTRRASRPLRHAADGVAESADSSAIVGRQVVRLLVTMFMRYAATAGQNR